MLRLFGIYGALISVFCIMAPCSCSYGRAAQAPIDAYPSTYQPLPRRDTLITNATILDGVGNRLKGSVLLRQGKIAAVGPNIQAPESTIRIEAEGRWITPGLVDVHSHLGDFAAPLTPADLRVSDVNEISDPNTAQVWALHSINVQDPQFARSLAGGVTTLQILPGSDNLFGGLGVILKNVPSVTVQGMRFPGARVSLKMSIGENPKYYYGGKGRFPSSQMGEFAGYRQAFIKAQEYQRRWDAYREKHNTGAMPPERDLQLETLVRVLRGEVPVHVHCYRADQMVLMLDLAKEFGFKISAFHHAVEAYKIADLFGRNQVCAAVWADWWGYKMEAYDGVRANAALIDAAGGCVTLHSDVAVNEERLNVDAETAMGAGRRAGLNITEKRAIRWLTSNPARVLGLEDRIGSIEVGKNADLVVWSGNPFSVYTKADLVFIDGAVVYDRYHPNRQPRSDFEVGQPSIGKRP